MSYQRDEVKAPRVSGVGLKAFVAALESPAGHLLLGKITRDTGIERWRDASAGDAPPVQCPLPHPPPPDDTRPLDQQARELVLGAPVTRRETVASFARAYRDGLDPLSVMRRLHDAIERIDGRDERLGLFVARKPDEVLAAAEASGRRLKAGKPLGLLDGVPVVLKDEVDLAGFPTTLGTRFRKDIATTDSTVAARLKAAGAVILGKVNMNEIGINPIGLNPWHGAARNPWNRGHITGGSSSASGAAVAAGVAPLAVGADGGGSIRIPAALCGVVGLKATWGRIPETGVPPLCWNVGHVGPLGLTVDDVAAMYAVLAGPDDHDVVSRAQPAPHLAGVGDGSLKGVRVGVSWPWFEDAEPDVVARCKAAVETLKAAGATLVELPPPDLTIVLWTHTSIILSEMSESMRPQVLADVTQFGLDTRTNLALGQHFDSVDYVHALRHRHRLTREWLELMKTCDVVVSPTTAMTAPAIPEAALPDGESNLPVVDALMRFIRIANLTGFPALTVPAGFDRAGMPVGVHLMARPWEEALLFRVGRVIEASVETRSPQVHVTALP